MRQELFWSPFLSLYNKEIHRIWKVVVQAVLTPILNSTLYLLIFGVSLGKSIPVQQGVSYLEFLIPGLVAMSVLTNSYQNGSASITAGKFTGELEDLKVVPLSLVQIILAFSLGGLTRGLVVGSVTLGVGQLFYYVMEGSFLAFSNWWVLLFFASVGALSFASLGMSVAIWAKTFDQMSMVGSLILQPLIYLGGVFMSLEILHEFWQGVSKLNPLLYIINGIRFGAIGVSDVDLGTAVIVSLIGLVVFYVIAALTLKRSTFRRW